jgi:hypothetical protein
MTPSLHDLPRLYELLTLESAPMRTRTLRSSMVRFLYGKHSGDLVGLASLRARRGSIASLDGVCLTNPASTRGLVCKLEMLTEEGRSRAPAPATVSVATLRHLPSSRVSLCPWWGSSLSRQLPFWLVL